MSSLNFSNSAEAFLRAKEVFPGGVNSPVRAFKSVASDPFFVSHAKGAYLTDIDGNRYIDYVLSWGPLVLGHAARPVVEAIVKQVELGTSYGACCELEYQLAQRIMEFFPSIEMLRFVNSGTEAGMSVIRLARAFTKRDKIIKFAGCYHGHCDALLVQAGSGVATHGIPDCAGVLESVTADTIILPFNDLSAVEEVFKLLPDEIAAVILEPVIGNAGLIAPEQNFLVSLGELVRKNKALVIFDEVMTGFRVDLRGAQKLYKVQPDLTMLGKVVGGGLPVGAFGGRKEILSLLSPLGPVYQAGTLSGNPLAMAAGLATLENWSVANTFDRTAEITQQLVIEMNALAKRYSVPFMANSVGTMFGFFFQAEKVINFEQAKRSDLTIFRQFFHEALAAGLYFAPSQFEAGFVSSAHIGEPLERTLAILKKVFAKLSSREPTKDA